MSSSDLPSGIPKTAPRYQTNEEITLQTIVTNNTPHPTLYANNDDDKASIDDIPVNGSEVIPSVVIDESGHLKLLQTKNDVHSLRETLHERSIEAKDLLSQMIHNAVAPAPVERHDPDPNPTDRSN